MNYYAIILPKLLSIVFNEVHFYKLQVLWCGGRREERVRLDFALSSHYCVKGA